MIRGALALLALQWTRTPLSGPGRALLTWSIPAAPLAVFTWAWLRGRAVGRIPLGPGVVAWVAGERSSVLVSPSNLNTVTVISAGSSSLAVNHSAADQLSTTCLA